MEVALKFNTRSPYVTELAAKLILQRPGSSSGSLKTSLEFTVDLDDDDKHLLNAQVTVLVEGFSHETSEKAFSISVTMECPHVFEAELDEATTSKYEFMRMVCEPIFHRATLLAEQNARDMGLSPIRLSPTFPKGDFKVSVLPSEPKSSLRAKPKRKPSQKNV